MTATVNGKPAAGTAVGDPAALPLFLPAKSPTPGAGPSGPAASGEAARRASPHVAVDRAAVDRGGVDWALVQRLRAQVAEQLAKDGQAGFGEQERELGRAVIAGLVAAEVRARLTSGAPWSEATELAHAKAVFDAVFGMGRFQPLLEDDTVENIVVTGYDMVLLEHVDGSVTRSEPVADSDQDLISWLDFIATRSEATARSFSPAQPHLDLRLDDGSRLAAAAWVHPRPTVVIRRHRLQRVTLEDLVARDTVTPVAASFLRACVRAGLSVVVSGPMSGGKTTLLRALCHEIPSTEMIGTFETERELFLHLMPERHPVVMAWESRPGSGEIGADGRQAGEITLSECLFRSFRFNLRRLIVGEIRGPEVWVMVKAMLSAAGSLSTTHSKSAAQTMDKLIRCAMEQGPSVTREVASEQLAEAIDIVVQMRLEDSGIVAGPGQQSPPSRSRWVCEILHVTAGEGRAGYATTQVFAPDEGGRRVRPAVLPDSLRALAAHGFDVAGYQRELAG